MLQCVEVIADPLDDLPGVGFVTKLLPQACFENVLIYG
jgi:hypothetical protein